MLSAVLELDLLCFGGLWTMEGYQRELDSPNSDLLGLSIPINPNASLLGMGCQWAILEEAHITLLAVHPDYQGQGLGQALLISLLTAAYENGLERATLEVRAANKPALSLYQKFGFKIAGRRRRYYKDTGEDALILWRGDLQEPEFQQTLAIWHSAIGDRLKVAGWDFQLTLNPLLPDSYP
jgi:ribosomal-protein-alanine N-acetyltransferase